MVLLFANLWGGYTESTSARPKATKLATYVPFAQLRLWGLLDGSVDIIYAASSDSDSWIEREASIFCPKSPQAVFPCEVKVFHLD